MEDTITIKVKETTFGQDKWFEYNLSYEDFEYIQPILERCKDKKECPLYDANNPESSLELLSKSFTMFNANNKKTIIYNLNELPKKEYRMSIGDVIDFYEKKNFILVEGDNIQTKPIF